MRRNPAMNRRAFIKASAAAGGGLLISLYLSSCADDTVETIAPTETISTEPTVTPNPEALFEPGVFVKIDGTGAVTITIHRPDAGQGPRTAFAMIVADELGADWDSVRVEQATADGRYGNQVTGGSLGVSQSYQQLRKAGAAARMVLIAAAANRWDVPEAECRTEKGLIIHDASGQSLTFADVVEDAANMPVPGYGQFEYKESNQLTLIGTSPEPLDHPPMVSGAAMYASDVRLPGMLYAVMARSPVPYGDLVSFDASGAEAVEGVQAVFAVADGVVVVADSSWAAIKGRQALDVAWDEGKYADLSTQGVRASMEERVVPDGWTGVSTDPNVLAAVYEVPFFAHATHETPGCVAHVQGDHCEIWAPTQVPVEAANTAAAAAGVSRDNLDLHIPYIGGAFGRRLEVDFIEEAASIAREVDAPVKLLWTREDDLQHDYYHPFSVHYVSARLDSPSLPKIKSATYERIPTGAWRAVTNVPEAFVRECFIDEMAVTLDRDPLELRLELEPPSFIPVLEKVAAESGWGSALPPGRGLGIACHATWGVSPVAQVAEVSVTPRGQVHVHRVVCAIDPGLVIHPEMVRAQMEGGIVYGLTAALNAVITFENGRVQQSNYHDYPLLRMDEMPAIEVHIIGNGDVPNGVGEMGNPPIAPAVMNAIFATTGVRVRHLPVRPEDLVGGA